MSEQPFPWNAWHAKAIAAGMAPETADAGRAMMRECHEHQWERYLGPGINQLCGLRDGGANMIEFGLAQPDIARRVWDILTADDAGESPIDIVIPNNLNEVLAQSLRKQAFPV